MRHTKTAYVCGAGNRCGYDFSDTWCKELSMMSFGYTASHPVTGGIAAGLISGAMLFAAPLALPKAGADPEPAPPPAPNCTAADMAGVAAGVAATTSAYLFAHPDVNDYFTSLKGTPRSEMRARLQQYMDANPEVRADLMGIRQPMTDFRNRCQVGESGLSGEGD
jgi:hemophore-related protein